MKVLLNSFLSFEWSHTRITSTDSKGFHRQTEKLELFCTANKQYHMKLNFCSLRFKAGKQHELYEWSLISGSKALRQLKHVRVG